MDLQLTIQIEMFYQLIISEPTFSNLKTTIEKLEKKV